MPGMPPGAKPGAPPRPRPAPKPHEAEAEEHGGHEHECPGHGPEDPPPPINLWRGNLMVDNERALSPGVLNQILFRYENPKDPCDPKNQAPPYTASLINFSILLFVLYYFGRKPVTEALLKRKEAITAEIDTATKLREDAEARLDEYEDRLENMHERLEEIRAEHAAQSEVEKKRVLAEAEERRVRMRRDAEFRIDQERKTVRDELLREAVAAATAAAEELIKKQIASADQDKMAAQYLASIGQAVAGTRAEGARSS
jgi:F-type H+-transporting ATPase subunit b